MIKNTLTFFDPVIARLFETYCMSNPPKGQVKEYKDGSFIYHNHFENVTARSKFIAGWASLSMERK